MVCIFRNFLFIKEFLRWTCDGLSSVLVTAERGKNRAVPPSESFAHAGARGVRREAEVCVPCAGR